MNTVLKFGLIGGIVLSTVLFFYHFELYNQHIPSVILTPLQLILLLTIILLGVKEKKSLHNNEINIRDAIMTGLGINTIIALMQSLFLYIYFGLASDKFNSFKEHILTKELESMRKYKFPAKDILKNLEIAKGEITPFNIAKGNFMQLLLIGLIISLIIAFFQRNKFEHHTK